MPDIVLNTLHILAHLIITGILGDRCFYYVHCTTRKLIQQKDSNILNVSDLLNIRTRIRTQLSSRSHFQNYSAILLYTEQKTNLKSIHFFPFPFKIISSCLDASLNSIWLKLVFIARSFTGFLHLQLPLLFSFMHHGLLLKDYKQQKTHFNEKCSGSYGPLVLHWVSHLQLYLQCLS